MLPTIGPTHYWRLKPDGMGVLIHHRCLISAYPWDDISSSLVHPTFGRSKQVCARQAPAFDGCLHAIF